MAIDGDVMVLPRIERKFIMGIIDDIEEKFEDAGPIDGSDEENE